MATYRRGATPGNFRTARAANRATPARSEAMPARSEASRVSVDRQAQLLANEILAERDAQRRISNAGKVYSIFDTVDDVLANNIETVTRGLFTGNTGSLTSMFSSSNLTATQRTYYEEIFSTGDPGFDDNASVEFSIAYGSFGGSGSKDLSGNLNNDTPTRAIYKQYAQTLLEPNDKKFTFGDGTDSDSIYIINFNRARIREKLDPGNFELSLAKLSGSAGVAKSSGLGFSNAGHTGSNVKLDGSGIVHQIIDDSSTSAAAIGESGQVYNLISGSIDQGTSIAAGPIYYGLLYPQHGIAVLNGDKLDDVLGFETVSGSAVQGQNALKLFTSLNGSNALLTAGYNGGVQARSSEQVKSTYYFVRAKNAEYNYSNNPTFVTGSLGQLTYNTFVNDPQTYITTVGLYNERRELLAVAKLSQPLLKNYTREALIKVKLDF